ncbi:hypothetical protein VHEMI06341 [[Torrubiella] hemipterigena]|uniref:Uncharacterized protein n=1 Tax=[Torrubiella] hemipterigena TaxID=1531966 RepID=A0A0A1T0B0_9HYPO|nr:hypothetical protein VHEMI06341 [[Torrubiella] hemipterigena]
MPMRNPFARRPGVVIPTGAADQSQTSPHPGFERVDTVGSKASSILSIRSNISHDVGEYKMSVVNDSGVYLPPSPNEELGHWSRKHLSSRASIETRSSFGDIEHFSISRESFDSYRRSFDVSARSPVLSHDPVTRQSLDSNRFPRHRPSVKRNIEKQPATPEESFEDIKLDEPAIPTKKKGFFAKLADTHDKDGAAPAVTRFLGRKRGHSGQGAELGHIERQATAPAEP